MRPSKPGVSAATSRPRSAGLPIMVRKLKPVSSGDTNTAWLFHGFCQAATRNCGRASPSPMAAGRSRNSGMRLAGQDRGAAEGGRDRQGARARNAARNLPGRNPPHQAVLDFRDQEFGGTAGQRQPDDGARIDVGLRMRHGKCRAFHARTIHAASNRRGAPFPGRTSSTPGKERPCWRLPAAPSARAAHRAD